MKNYKIWLILLVFLCFSSVGFCDSLSSQGKYSIKLNLQDPSDISAKANKAPSYGSNSELDPILNSEINGIGNAIQGLTGNTGNIYSMQEQRKQQGEYTKQQIKNPD